MNMAPEGDIFGATPHNKQFILQQHIDWSQLKNRDGRVGELPLDAGTVISLLGQQSCSIECDGNLDATKIRLCRDVLLEVERDPVELIKQRLGEEVEGKQLNLAKRYGGFMKRYGGFMIRRNLPTQGGALDGEDTPVAEEDDIRLEILKILNAEAEGLRDGKRDEVKRYGGFIRSEEDLGARHGPGRPLKKRYGGFMRRVGRPEWGETQNIQQGALKRRWEAGHSARRC
ncbi:hypothetical protein DPEC_G00067340 [Dallia pectoralis]|uniref:Uncharacterized protein n=1 Tax=Dallia pectoralis TaxID=75939 RepID=A0ACC2H8J2_DALPE|nr:hypothetical protein DPEC_G00067340 [Dallia pectoralis]